MSHPKKKIPTGFTVPKSNKRKVPEFKSRATKEKRKRSTTSSLSSKFAESNVEDEDEEERNRHRKKQKYEQTPSFRNSISKEKSWKKDGGSKSKGMERFGRR